jgi:signal transduction histidine kinase
MAERVEYIKIDEASRLIAVTEEYVSEIEEYVSEIARISTKQGKLVILQLTKDSELKSSLAEIEVESTEKEDIIIRLTVALIHSQITEVVPDLNNEDGGPIDTDMTTRIRELLNPNKTPLIGSLSRIIKQYNTMLARYFAHWHHQLNNALSGFIANAEKMTNQETAEDYAKINGLIDKINKLNKELKHDPGDTIILRKLYTQATILTSKLDRRLSGKSSKALQESCNNVMRALEEIKEVLDNGFPDEEIQLNDFLLDLAKSCGVEQYLQDKNIGNAAITSARPILKMIFEDLFTNFEKEKNKLNRKNDPKLIINIQGRGETIFVNFMDNLGKYTKKKMGLLGIESLEDLLSPEVSSSGGGSGLAMINGLLKAISGSIEIKNGTKGLIISIRLPKNSHQDQPRNP